MNWLLLVLGLEFPVLLALLDCFNREPEGFEDGASDRTAWLGWLLAALVLPLVGYGVVLGYYWSVVKRDTSSR